MNRLADDLDHVLARTRELWEETRGKRIFVTGGTGFFGSWLLESFVWANDHLSLNSEIHVLTRSEEAFAEKAPHLANHPAVRFHHGDVRSFDFPPGTFAYVIHAATAASAKLNEEDGLLMLDTVMQGTRRTLDFARSCQAEKFLLTSSGAVYGPQPSELSHVGEEYLGGPDPMALASSYGEGKRLAELLCAIYHRQYGLETKIARCFAFVGPYLPLNSHFAIGNFIRDALAGSPVRVGGDGTPYRSYLYAADLVIWLWTILFKGDSCLPYNVGSEQDLTISELAGTVAHAVGSHPVDVRIALPPISGKLPSRYVPATRRAYEDLGLQTLIELPDAIRRTAKWAKECSSDMQRTTAG